MKDIFLKLVLNILKSYMIFTMIYLPFLTKRIKIENDKKFVANLHEKEELFIHPKNSKQALDDGLGLDGLGLYSSYAIEILG